VVEDGSVVEEQPEVGLEAVGARAQGLFEGRDRVLFEPLRRAPMTVNQERLSHP
jgi:hypothetical protein